MKICFCIDKLVSGGAERVITSLANAFVDKGHEVSLVEISSKCWNSFYKVDNNVKHIFLLDNIKKNTRIRKIRLLRKVIISLKPDAVISFKYQSNINVALAIRGLKIPHIVSERNDPKSYSVGKIINFLKKPIFKHATGCVFQTEEAMRYYFKKPNDRCRIIANPIFLQTHFINDGTTYNKTVVTVGRLVEQKNIPMIIDAFESVFKNDNEYILKIYGTGDCEHKIKEYALSKYYSQSIHFMGVSNNWHSDEYQSRLFVMTSRYEGMPNALMEAMALGIPSISTDCPCGGPKRLIQNYSNGILIPVDDLDILKTEMVKMTCDIEKCRAFSIANSDMRNTYSLENVANQWLDFITHLLERN